MDFEKTSKNAEDDLKSKLDAYSLVNDQLRGDPSLLGRPNIYARNILHEELGYFGPVETRYRLDTETRDRLIAHARQDAALASFAVSELEERVKREAFKTRVYVTILAVALAIVVGFLAA